MKHLNAINKKAARVVAATAPDVVALQQGGAPQQPEAPHIPPGCSLVFSPGWEAVHAGGTAGLCSPVERDRTAKCAVAQKDWRKIDLVFPG